MQLIFSNIWFLTFALTRIVIAKLDSHRHLNLDHVCIT